MLNKGTIVKKITTTCWVQIALRHKESTLVNKT